MPQHRWEKGESGNPKGRPKKGQSLTEILREYIEGKDSKTREQRAKILAKKLYNLAIKYNDIQAIKYIYDRVDGRPSETIDMKGTVGYYEVIPPVKKTK